MDERESLSSSRRRIVFNKEEFSNMIAALLSVETRADDQEAQRSRLEDDSDTDSLS
jgi:predicted DNA binding CopG/RHH family protein